MKVFNVKENRLFSDFIQMLGVRYYVNLGISYNTQISERRFY